MKRDSEKMDFDLWNNDRKRRPAYDEELYVLCMRRFLYVRCYDSFEFLATLKVRSVFVSSLSLCRCLFQ
jgi:hypothetical protein